MDLADNALTTLETVKMELLIEDDTNDNHIIRMINVASDQIEKYCNRKFKKDLYESFYDTTVTGKIITKEYPVIDIGYLSVNNVEVDPLQVQGDRESGIIRLPFKGKSYIVYRAGYVLPKDHIPTVNPRTLPYDLEQACIELVRFKYNERFGGSNVASLPGSKEVKSETLGDWKVDYFEGSKFTDVYGDNGGTGLPLPIMGTLDRWVRWV